MRLIGHNSQKTLPLVTACVVTGHLGYLDYPRKKVKQDFTLALFSVTFGDVTRFFVQPGRSNSTIIL